MTLNRLERSRVTKLILAIVVLLALTAGLLSSIRLTSPAPAYPLDDTYIGMAMARNLAFHGVWGVTRYAFSSSGSSPLFVLLLAACYRITGVNEWWPLVLSIGFAVLA